MSMKEIEFGGVTATQVFAKLQTAVSDDDAKRFVANWVWENTFSAGRSFSYSLPLSPVSPTGSTAPFQRTFVHLDWTDGESSVQAEQTPTEEGFNERFHKIEHDLDRLGAMASGEEVAGAALRAALARSLDEIRAELNRINADLAAIKRPPSTAPVIPHGVLDTGFTPVGQIKIENEIRDVWRLEDGRILTLPVAIEVNPGVKFEPRAPGVGDIFLRDDDIKAILTGPLKVSDLKTRFGQKRGPDGRQLSELLASLPDETTFATGDALLLELSDRDAALMRGVGADTRALETLGVGVGKATEAPVARIDGVTGAIGEALIASNVATLGDLAGLSGFAVRTKLAEQNVLVSESQAAQLVTLARTLRHF